jgi:hypothetical protein
LHLRRIIASGANVYQTLWLYQVLQCLHPRSPILPARVRPVGLLRLCRDPKQPVLVQKNTQLSRLRRLYAFVEVDALIAQHAITSSSVDATRNSITGPNAKEETPEPEAAARQQEDADNQKKKKKATVSTIEAPPLTGIVEMDEEHRDCTVALNHLLQYSTSIPALQAAVDVLAEHFGHEEELLKTKYGRNNDDDDSFPSFSPCRSHQKDHERILAIGRAELQRLALSS